MYNYITPFGSILKYPLIDTSVAMVGRCLMIKWTTICTYHIPYCTALLLTLIVLNLHKIQECYNV